MRPEQQEEIDKVCNVLWLVTEGGEKSGGWIFESQLAHLLLTLGSSLVASQPYSVSR